MVAVGFSPRIWAEAVFVAERRLKLATISNDLQASLRDPKAAQQRTQSKTLPRAH